GGPQARERTLELERLLDRLADELLEDRLAPRLQRALAETAREALDAGEPDAADLDRVTVEHGDAAIHEGLLHLGRLVGLVVVVAEHGHHRHLGAGELAREALRLVHGAGVGQVAAEREDVRALGNLAEHRRQRPRRHRLGAMEDAEGGGPEAARVHRATAPSSRRALNDPKPSRRACSGSMPDMNVTVSPSAPPAGRHDIVISTRVPPSGV